MRNIRRLSILATFLIAVLLLTGCGNKDAGKNAKSNFPAREISLVCGYAPGGSSDLIDRALIQSMNTQLPHPVVFVNRDGANGTVS